MAEPRIPSRTVEFLRSGSAEWVYSPENEYLRAEGFDQVVERVRPTLDRRGLLKHLRKLRYQETVGDEADQAATDLAAEVSRFLPAVAAQPGSLSQLDVVTMASELWALPMEACYAGHPEWLEGPDTGVVLSRRIRSGFTGQALPWPEAPRVLFAHAPADEDLSEQLIGQHTAAIRTSLAAWSGGGADETWFHRVEVLSVDGLGRARDKFRPSYVHLLAHGKQYVPDEDLPEDKAWGLRLGYRHQPGTASGLIAGALVPDEGVPLVVTLAVCDSANATAVLDPHLNLVQELHRRGVPVVVGSQLPLTRAGSVTFTAAFYRRLLVGEDVRLALHAGRVALRRDPAAHHDWLSLVGYVRLPESYGESLEEFGLRAELSLLRALQDQADALIGHAASVAEFSRIERQLDDRLAALELRLSRLDDRRQDLVDECGGLLASAGKRLAELHFRRSVIGPPEQRQHYAQAARDALRKSLSHYQQSFHRNIHHHWVGVQALALEAALDCRFSHPHDRTIVRRAAELRRDAEPGDFWPPGTLAEIHLLAPLDTGGPETHLAHEAIRELIRRRGEGHAEAVASTRRQLRRYVDWWTRENGYFEHRDADLSAPAQDLIATLDKEYR
jgi:hypothetical protein